METINKVRTRHFVQGKNISEIARELNLSRNTVKKYLIVQHLFCKFAGFRPNNQSLIFK